MAKGRHQKDKLWLIHSELGTSKVRKAAGDGEATPFNTCGLSYVTLSSADGILADQNGIVSDHPSPLHPL